MSHSLMQPATAGMLPPSDSDEDDDEEDDSSEEEEEEPPKKPLRPAVPTAAKYDLHPKHHSSLTEQLLPPCMACTHTDGPTSQDLRLYFAITWSSS